MTGRDRDVAREVPSPRTGTGDDGLTVLLVEDSPSDAVVIRAMLTEKHGADLTVRHTETLADGLATLAESPPDCVLLDLNLPDSDGLDTLDRVLATAPEVPVTVLTGTSLPSSGLSALRRGAQDFLVKDKIDADLLDRTLRYAVERHRLSQALRRGEERYRTTVEALLDGLVIHRAVRDSEGRVTDLRCEYANPTAADFLHMQQEEIVGLSLKSLLTTEGHTPFEHYVDVVETGRPLERLTPWDYGDGVIGTIEVKAGRLGDGLVIAFRDVTRREQAEAQVRALNAELEQRVGARTAELAETNARLVESNRQLAEFSYSVAHDLRGPLRAIHGYSELILADHAGGLDPEAQTLFGKVMASTTRLGSLIDGLLALTKANTAPLSVQHVDMATLVRSTLDEVRAAEPDRAVTVRVDDLPDVIADPNMLRQVWFHLLSNALRFTRGRTDAQVNVTAEAVGNEVAYHVRDNGIGYDPAYQQKLFSPFQRLHGAEYSGNGVGLAIVKRVVERHEGQVWAQGEPGEGACFSFTLPLRVTADG